MNRTSVLLCAVMIASLGVVSFDALRRTATHGSQEGRRIPVTELDFETAGLPEGWEAWDNIADGLGVPARHVWAADSCESWDERGGSASGWALRGGVIGTVMPCGGANSEPVDTALAFGPFDSREFVNGIEVGLDVKLDLAVEEAFLVCLSSAVVEEPLECFSAGVESTEWASFDPPVFFPRGGGQESAMLYLLFRDRDPEPGHLRFGAYVDNVRLIGLAPPATATSTTPTVTATAAVSATSTATTTMTLVPGSPTVPSTSTPTIDPEITPTVIPTADGTREATATPDGTETQTPASTLTSTPTSTPTSTQNPTPGISATPTGDATHDPSDGSRRRIYVALALND